MSERTYTVRLAKRATSKWRSEIINWLDEMGRRQYLVSMKLRGHPLEPDMIIVLNDRTTAIILKLALG